MQLTDFETRPFHQLDYLNARSGGGVERVRLPFLRGRVDALPSQLDALVLTADLQGHELGGAGRLLGEVVVDELESLAAAGALPDLARVGVVLAGDFYARRGRRGGLGDVTGVWRAFTDACRWVAGVAGNHDRFGHDDLAGGFARYQRRGAGHLLDGDVQTLDGLRIGGVSGIVGNPGKANRRDAEAFEGLLLSVLLDRPSLVVLHDGPDHPTARDHRGQAGIRDVLADAARPTLVVRGHRPWAEAWCVLDQHVQVVNVHERVLVLTA